MKAEALHPRIYELARERWPQVSGKTHVHCSSCETYVIPIYDGPSDDIWARWAREKRLPSFNREEIHLEEVKLPPLRVIGLGYGPRTDTLVIQLPEEKP